MNNSKIRTALVVLVLTLIQLGVIFGRLPQTVAASPRESSSLTTQLQQSESIVGAWYLTVTSETAAAPFKGMITFSEGGGLVASAQGDILLAPPPGVPPLATAGHGQWSRNANREYLFSFRQIFYNGDGSYAGGAKIRNLATLNKEGTEMSGQLLVEYYDANDNVVFTGTGTFTGTRISAEPLTP